MEPLATTADAPPADGGERAAPDPAYVCLWCGTAFQPRTDGGTAQRFCKPGCRRAFDQPPVPGFDDRSMPAGSPLLTSGMALGQRAPLLEANPPPDMER
jgi:hypothetical protein